MVTSMAKQPKNIIRGDIYYVNREPEKPKGHEQRPGRPAIIVSDFHTGGDNTCMVVYLTTNRDRRDPGNVHVKINSAPKPSIALCNQIKTIDVKCLDRYCGHLTSREMAAVNAAMTRALSLLRVDHAQQAKDEIKRLKKQLEETQQQAESWRKMAVHLTERGA